MDSTLIIALYGAVLSTAVFVFDMFKYFRDKPRVVVKVKFSLSYENADLNKEKKKICIETINSGKRPLTIANCGFKLKTESIMNIQQVIDPNLPKQLSEGEAYSSYTDFVAGDAEKIIYAWVKDASGKEYKSRKWPLKGF